MNTTPALMTHHLTKRYGGRAAVDDLSIEIPTGVVAGFIGPNGAGKTTTMAMLLGLVAPTAGNATVLGSSIDDPASYLGRVGALIETPAFWPGLTGVENLRVLATLSGHDPGRIPDALNLVGLNGRGGDRFGQYSLGMKQRLGIAAALLDDPELLVLDEPTNGLDPRQIIEARELIRTLSRELSIIVTSHILAEIERVAHRVAILLDGKLLSVHTLGAQGANTRLRVRLRSADEAAVRSHLNSVPGVSIIEAVPTSGIYLLDSANGTADAIRALVQGGFAVEEVSATGSGLEELFLRLTEAAGK
jgi:ABC-2 type transport system ATP-binding protein